MDSSEKKKHLAALIIQTMPKPKGYKESSKDEEGGEDAGDDYEAAAEEILSCIQDKDAKGLAENLKSFFKMCDMEPHKEGSDLEDEEES